MALDSFMMALSRFTDHPEVPLVCYSDNGTNLVAGEQEIRDAIARWNPEALAKNMDDRKIEWQFSPAAVGNSIDAQQPTTRIGRQTRLPRHLNDYCIRGPR
jgi:hypothetical protein